jgi:hypothetical protein
MFHDAAEAVLSLAVSRLCSGVDPAKLTFADYFRRLEEASCSLPFKAEMLRLNSVRVDVKHQTIVQSPETIAEMRSVTTAFLAEAGILLFGRSITEVSELQLVEDAETRVELEGAERELSRGGHKDAIAHAAVAFHRLMYRHELRWADAWGRSPFRSHHHGFSFVQRQQLGPLTAYFGDVMREVEDVRAMIRNIAFKLDFARYVKFASLAPHVFHTASDAYLPEWVGDPGVPEERTEAHARFCIDFVVDTALEFQRVTAEPLRGNPPPTLW